MAEVTVDARGHRCPIPTLRLRRALERAQVGTVVTLLADDPLARIDVPHFAAGAGCEVLESGAAEGGGWRFSVVRRRPPAGDPPSAGPAECG